MRIKKVSIIIPCFNEKDTIEELLQRVFDVTLPGIEKEIIVVDDGSTDGSNRFLLQQSPQFKLVQHPKNLGKGQAIRSALRICSGDIILIQDADLEYCPTDYAKLLGPIINEETQVVYGRRVFNMRSRSVGEYCYFLGRVFLTSVTNVLFNARLRDLNTCYKVFDKEILEYITITSDGFEFCSELTAKILKQKIGIKEIPIKYFPRTRMEGKKILMRDGWISLWMLLRVRFA